MASGEPTRRQVLGALATGGIASLAGCSRVVYDDYLKVDIPEIREQNDRFVGRYIVENRRPPRPTPTLSADETTDEPRPYKTRYEGVQFLGYDADGKRVTTAEIGTLSPEAEAAGRFEASGFPLVITADAKRAVTETDDDYLADQGAHIDGYFGQYDDRERSPTDETGYVWMELGNRRLSDSLPPSARLFGALKCRHRRLRREGDPPNLGLVPNSDEWVNREIPDPTIHEIQWINIGGDLDSGAYDPPGTVEIPFAELPRVIRKSFRKGLNAPWMDRETFLSVASDVAGERFQTVEDLPPCSADHVVCHDSRGENCRGGGGQFAGESGKYVWFETTFRETRRPVVLGYEESWKPPDAEPLSPCSGERSETYTVRTTDGLDRIAGLEDGKRVEPVPPAAKQYLDARQDERPYYRTTVDEAAFERLIDGLDSAESGRFPSCRRSHVRCLRVPSVHCGRGRRQYYYQLPEEESVRGLVAIYEWTGKTE